MKNNKSKILIIENWFNWYDAIKDGFANNKRISEIEVFPDSEGQFNKLLNWLREENFDAIVKKYQNVEFFIIDNVLDGIRGSTFLKYLEKYYHKDFKFILMSQCCITPTELEIIKSCKKGKGLYLYRAGFDNDELVTELINNIGELNNENN